MFQRKLSLNSREGVLFDSSTAKPDTPLNGFFFCIDRDGACEWLVGVLEPPDKQVEMHCLIDQLFIMAAAIQKKVKR